MLKEFSQLLGPLRLVLALVLGILAAMAPFALAPTSYEGWAFATTVIVPALVPIFFFVTLLDVLMSAVFMSSSSGERRAASHGTDHPICAGRFADDCLVAALLAGVEPGIAVRSLLVWRAAVFDMPCGHEIQMASTAVFK